MKTKYVVETFKKLYDEKSYKFNFGGLDEAKDFVEKLTSFCEVISIYKVKTKRIKTFLYGKEY